MENSITHKEAHTVAPSFLDFKTVCHVLGLKPGRAARTFLWRHARDGEMPRPYKIGPNKIAWRSEQIREFVASRKPAEYTKGAA